MTDCVRAVERAYVAAATGAAPPAPAAGDPARALAAIGAVASRYLAVGTPRTLGLIADDATAAHAAASIDAHRTWFQPRELRVSGSPALAAALGAAAVSVAEALASDIVCIHVPVALRAGELRRGTHVNALAACTLDDELGRIAVRYDEHPHLGALAAGLIDGRQLDEITIFVVGDAAIALATCSPSPDPR
jgi:ornithine cyclodeaminase/alanine dehydrogenase-like protein (mu-crystallin family)